MAINFDNILLEREQEDLLIALVEASRQQPRDRREKFRVEQVADGSLVYGLDSYPNAYEGDIEILGEANLLNCTHDSYGALTFGVTPLGFRYYEHLMKSRGTATERVEESVSRYLDSAAFTARHPDAFAKWQQAQELLWDSDSQNQHTIIGHLCREAMQSFGTSLIEAYQPPNVESDVTKTKDRLKAVIQHRKSRMSDKVTSVLEAMLVYWYTLIDLDQRQEHGAQKEGETLTWEDSRRLVFQTAVVMFEIDRALHL